MWAVPGREVEGAAVPFTTIRPDRVLYEFDGPRTFTVVDERGDLYLAHWSDEDGNAVRYIVAPTSPGIVSSLEEGRASVRQALEQPHVWVLDVDHQNRLSRAWRAEISMLPDDALPSRGVMLLSSLEPFLALKAIGQNIIPGNIPASAIISLVDGAQKALKKIVDFVQDLHAPGRPFDVLRRLYDLPAQRIGFSSFEIAFRPPKLQEPEPDFIQEEQVNPERIIGEIGALLEVGLDWALQPAAWNADAEELLPQDLARRRVILEALKKLVPSSRGVVAEVEVYGTILPSQTRRSYRLTRATRRRVADALAALPAQQEIVGFLTGRIREVDKDRLSFDLREIRDQPAPTHRFNFEEDLLDEVMAALDGEFEVRVASLMVEQGPSRAFGIFPVPGEPPELEE